MFFQSLLCRHGQDNAGRFIWISAACYLYVLILQKLLMFPVVPTAIFSLPAVYLLGLTAFRRVRQTTVPLALATLAPAILLLFATVGSWLVSWSYIFLAVGLVTTIVGSLKNRSEGHTLGYEGELDLEQLLHQDQQVTVRQRFEPSMDGAEVVETQNVKKSQSASWTQLYIWLNQGLIFTNKNLKPVQGALAAIAFLLLFTLPVDFSTSEPEATVSETEDLSAQPVEVREFAQLPQFETRVAMPDDFTVLLDENAAIALLWQADTVPNGIHWSQLTGKGDASCEQIRFSKNDTVRPVQVQVHNGENYYARFSPMDTKRLIQSIAKRSKFNLCGYEFSLSGTMKQLQYDPMLEPYL